MNDSHYQNDSLDNTQVLSHEPSFATINVQTGLSIIIPTFREVENIPVILERLNTLRQEFGLTLEVLFMDDNSQDGSEEAVAASGYSWARIIVRTEDFGLSPAVLDGFRAACYPVLICMDCDLSHPVEKIPALVLALSSGQEMVIGSRYVSRGSTDDNWGVFRWLNSRVATLLARPLTSVRDPMAGFFALRKADFEKAQELSPIGYKIGLELIIKCSFDNVGEVPIAFTDRIAGESKLSLREQLKFIKHLRRLYIHKFSESMHVLQFMVVGLSGVVVNLAVLSLLQSLGLSNIIAIAGGIAVSMITNFLLNRRFSFSYARDTNILRQFGGFVLASLVGAGVNFTVAIMLQESVFSPTAPYALQISALLGVLAGMTFNFLANRYIVFKKRFIR